MLRFLAIRHLSLSREGRVYQILRKPDYVHVVEESPTANDRRDLNISCHLQETICDHFCSGNTLTYLRTAYTRKRDIVQWYLDFA